jgi:hypothetical protein
VKFADSLLRLLRLPNTATHEEISRAFDERLNGPRTRELQEPSRSLDALVHETVRMLDDSGGKRVPGTQLAPTDQHEFHRLAEKVVERSGVSLSEAYRALARAAPDAYDEYRKAVDVNKSLGDVDATGPGDDAVHEFARLVKERMQNDNLDIAAAIRAVASEFPGVYQKYRDASYAPEIPRGAK